MFKKVLAGIFALALVLSFCVVPASADDFGSYCWFDAEYKDGSLQDKYGAHLDDLSAADNTDKVYPADDGVTPVTIADVTDTDGNTFKAAQFRGSGLEYLHYKDTDSWVADPGFGYLNKDFTMETYVMIKNTGWGMVAGSWYENSTYTNGWGIQMGYNAAIQGGIGKANQISVIDGSGAFQEQGTVHTTLAGGKARNKWLHIVLTNTGGQNTLYVNGESVGTEAAIVEEYACMADTINSGFRVGGYRPATNQFCLEMDCAYVRLYRKAATAEEAKALYDNKLGAAPNGSNPEGGGTTPTQAPSGDPTQAPSGDPTQAPSGDTTPAPTTAPVNPPKTFDLGIVSIAAMALTPLVIFKKKKK